ncbi:DUF7079 family protein [Pseudomonas viridiflava]|uniref:DUF7079 family protein n=1 Tax=Pseudomonas viridiflava TaxID=33069 RepID=UPI000F02B07A|nr:hypothetical protein [Pseudomonas viridiflava]
MGYFLSKPELTAVRAALSEAFNGLPTDYDYIAHEVKGVDVDTLYEIFFSEVAPVCFTNIAAAVPSVWTGFDPDSLSEVIEARLAERERNWVRRLCDRLLVRWLRYNYDYVWREIAGRL